MKGDLLAAGSTNNIYRDPAELDGTEATTVDAGLQRGSAAAARST